MSQWFVLKDDSAGADTITPLLVALHTATAAKYSGTVAQSIRIASYDATILLVKANITDAERTGALAALARPNYGVGIFKDEYPTHAVKDLEAFSIVGEAPANIHYESPDEPDGSWNWTARVLPDSSGDGRTYGDRIVGVPTDNGPGGSVILPPANNGRAVYHGFFVPVWPGNIGGRTIAGFASIKMSSGASPTDRLHHHFDHWLKPGALCQGLILQNGNPWVKDSITNAYSVIEGNGSHGTSNKHKNKPYDPDMETFEFAGELEEATDVADCKATPGTYFFDDTLDGGLGGWWAHMPDGSDPTGRVAGLGEFGFRLNFRHQPAAETHMENLEFHGLKARLAHLELIPSGGAGIAVMTNIRFNMLNLKYAATDNPLFSLIVQALGLTKEVSNIEIYVDQISRGENGIYIISQDGNLESGKFENLIVQADPKARDGRENIFDIGGAKPNEANSDGHAVAPQMIDGMDVGYLKTRRCGGHIVCYWRNWIHATMNTTNRPVKDVLIHDNDIAENSAFNTSGTSGKVGISVNADNNLVYPATNIIIRDNTVNGYDQIPANVLNYCIRTIIPDPVVIEGNHCDLAAIAQLDVAKNISHKWIVLSGSAGNWNLDDFIEDAAAPGTKIGRIVKIEGANPTVMLHYCHPMDQVATAQDIATGVSIVNQDDTGTGTTNGANGSRGLGYNAILRESATRKNRFGNSNGTALWIRGVTGAAVGGPDRDDRLTGGWYMDDQDTEYVGATGYKGFDLTGAALSDLPTYQARSDTGNIYGLRAALIAP